MREALEPGTPRMLMNVTKGQAARIDAGPKPLWECRFFRLGVLVTLIGGLLWTYAVLSDEAGFLSSANAAVATPTPADGRVDPAPTAAAVVPQHAAPSPAQQMMLDWAPPTFRFGSAFCVAYTLAWGLRRYARATLIASTVVALGGVGLQKLGMLSIDWNMARAQAHELGTFFDGHTEAFRGIARGYMPTIVAACLGLLFGIRHR